MADQQKLTRDELERARPHEGMTAKEWDELRLNNQPSKINDEGDNDE